jgi:hypothetical protein
VLTLLLLFIVGPQAGGNDRGVILSIIYDSSRDQVAWSEWNVRSGAYLNTRTGGKHTSKHVDDRADAVAWDGVYIVGEYLQPSTVKRLGHGELFKHVFLEPPSFFSGRLTFPRESERGWDIVTSDFDGEKLGKTQVLATDVLERSLDQQHPPSHISASASGDVVTWGLAGHIDALHWVYRGHRMLYEADGIVENCVVSRSGKVIYILERDDFDLVIGLDPRTGEKLFTRRYGFKTVQPMAPDESSENLLFVRYQLESDWSDDVEFLWHATVIDAKGEVVKEFELDVKE